MNYYDYICELSTCQNSSTGRSFAFPGENARHWRENREDRQDDGFSGWQIYANLSISMAIFSFVEPRHHITIVYRDGLTTALNLRPFLGIIGIPQDQAGIRMHLLKGDRLRRNLSPCCLKSNHRSSRCECPSSEWIIQGDT